jgi:hypothetical protein
LRSVKTLTSTRRRVHIQFPLRAATALFKLQPGEGIQQDDRRLERPVYDAAQLEAGKESGLDFLEVLAVDSSCGL